MKLPSWRKSNEVCLTVKRASREALTSAPASLCENAVIKKLVKQKRTKYYKDKDRC